MPWSPISEARETPLTAKQIRLMCPHCHNSVTVHVPWDCSAFKRSELVRDAIDVHRRVCTAADAAEERVYSIEYPRL